MIESLSLEAQNVELKLEILALKSAANVLAERLMVTNELIKKTESGYAKNLAKLLLKGEVIKNDFIIGNLSDAKVIVPARS